MNHFSVGFIGVLMLIASRQGLAANTGSMESSQLKVVFDAGTQEMGEIINLNTGEKVKLAPVTAFRIEMDQLQEGQKLTRDMAGRPASLVIDARKCGVETIAQESAADGGLLRSITYRSPHGKIVVEVTLGKSDHFILKRLRFEPAFSTPYLVRRVLLQGFRFAEPPKKFVRFVHGECRTYFLRDTRGGFFCGVQVPLPVELPENGKGMIELAYETNYRHRAGEVHESETLFWGGYVRSGQFAPKVPTRSSEAYEGRLPHTQSPVPPEQGESEAMLRMVCRLTTPSPRAVVSIYNGWSPASDRGKVRFNFSSSSPPVADPEKTYAFLLEAKAMLGEPLVHMIMPWGGMWKELASVGPETAAPPSSPGQQQLYEFARKNDIKFIQYANLKSPFGWEAPWHYCASKKSWHGVIEENADACPACREYGHKRYHPWHVSENCRYNCPGCREYVDWFSRILIGSIEQAKGTYGGYILDEGDPWPRTRLPCAGETHDHLPGDAAYGYFRVRRDLYRALRKRYGPMFHLDQERPAMDSGVWDMLYLNSVLSLDEYNRKGGEQIRYFARIRHYYHFVPSYIDQAILDLKNAPEQEYLVLSALAVSNTHIYVGLPRVPAQARTVRRWLDWARAQPDLMRAQAVFLPDWPGSGNCDGYLRLADGRGYAFLFNANEQNASIRVPLDQSVGLNGAETYTLDYVYPRAAAVEPLTATGYTRFTLPPRSVYLVSIRPR